MTKEQAFDELYKLKGYPEELKTGLLEIFEEVFVNVSQRMIKENLNAYILDPDVVMSYVCEEHFFNMSLIKKEEAQQLISNPSYVKRLITIVSDKILFNEFKGYENENLVSEYSPLVTTYNFFLNFILNRFASLNGKLKVEQAILLDVLKKGFVMSKSILNLLVNGYETEAFSTWRTFHEVECIAKILFENPEISNSYVKHIDYARYYRSDNGDKEKKELLYQEVKDKMKLVNLKSKDTKKFIEYGWLYDIKDVETRFPEFKPNFRKGVELIAGLSEYSSVYELSSELAHSSPLLIYSNREYFMYLTLINLYETFFRMENILYNFLITQTETNSSSYFSMRKDYLFEMKKNIAIERIRFNLKFK